MQRFSELASHENNNLPHLIPPTWDSTHTCFCCKKTVPVGAQPWALQVTCREAVCPANDILENWRHIFRSQNTLIRSILETLLLKCPDKLYYYPPLLII